ncbi:MFS transporter [Erythrobacter sp. GH1-10]|uniref:MFS transporter n=1 Tax=Erythrobacter sp. GH1-10 TaxID=3349334 RepID=UPI003878220D
MKEVLINSLRLRLAAFFVLYFSQGLPLGLLGPVVSAWLAANGASAGDIALVGTATSLPWALKFLLGFVIDRYTFLPMGRRRIWIIGAQSLVMMVLIVGAVLSPTASDIHLIAALGFSINMCTSIHDVAVDGLAVDILEEEDRPRASAWMFGGQALGAAVAAVAGGLVVTNWGISPALLAIAFWFAGAMFFVVRVREREGERGLPWESGQAHPANEQHKEILWRTVLGSAFRALVAPASLLFLLVALVKGFQMGVFGGAAPLIATGSLGWEADEFGVLAGAVTIIAALSGMILGGRLGNRFGPARCLLAILTIFLVLDFVAVSGLLNWESQVAVIGFAVAWVISDVLMLIFLVAVAMSLCDKRAGAAQFTIYMALANLGTVAGAASVGLSDPLGGPPMLFSLTLLAHVLAACVMILLIKSQFRKAGTAKPAAA